MPSEPELPPGLEWLAKETARKLCELKEELRKEFHEKLEATRTQAMEALDDLKAETAMGLDGLMEMAQKVDRLESIINDVVPLTVAEPVDVEFEVKEDE